SSLLAKASLADVLELLILEGYSVTGFVRRKEHAGQIEASGASVIMGDLGDKASITQQTLKHDVVILTATADHLPSAEAILDGVRQRASNGQMTTYIHTSGTGVLDDGAAGMHKSDRVYHDSVKSEIDSVPDNAPHREIDLAIARAQEDLGDKAKIAIMIPPLIYGFNPKHKRLAIQIPTLTRFALKHGYAAHIGTGAPVESNIHVLALARAYLVLLHHLEATPSATALANPYSFCESTDDAEPSWGEIASLIGRSLHQAGLIRDATPKELPRELYSDVFGPLLPMLCIGLKSRSRAVRLRELGWEPREKDWRRSLVEDELPKILRDVGEGFMGYRGTVAS
ncbi:hypothetical protein D0860_02957, partial [Hortaea werneckii]